jgi:hypothetical protein
MLLVCVARGPFSLLPLLFVPGPVVLPMLADADLKDFDRV